jgi:hypothetical protein
MYKNHNKNSSVWISHSFWCSYPDVRACENLNELKISDNSIWQSKCFALFHNLYPNELQLWIYRFLGMGFHFNHVNRIFKNKSSLVVVKMVWWKLTFWSCSNNFLYHSLLPQISKNSTRCVLMFSFKWNYFTALIWLTCFINIFTYFMKSMSC